VRAWSLADHHVSVDDALVAARLYWSMRWLGADQGHGTVDRHIGYIDVLEATAHQLGLVAVSA
jgi:hypothetical protein